MPYNLIVGFTAGTVTSGRMLETVDPGLRVTTPDNLPDVDQLRQFPTLVIEEVPRDGDVWEPARVGKIVSLQRGAREYRYEFAPNPKLPPIPSEKIREAGDALGLNDWSFRHSCWDVKDRDLYQVLYEQEVLSVPQPTVFKLPRMSPDPKRITAMMPFAGFGPVYEAMKEAAAEGGWVIERADDIWEDTTIINDIVALIVRSSVVICDLTNSNANVFYETGIAHTLGRQVILIARSDKDVPFDLRHHRYLRYDGNGEGIEKLKVELGRRLHTLLDRK